jgi:hypothetical protein
METLSPLELITQANLFHRELDLMANPFQLVHSILKDLMEELLHMDEHLMVNPFPPLPSTQLITLASLCLLVLEPTVNH